MLGKVVFKCLTAVKEILKKIFGGRCSVSTTSEVTN